MSYPINNQQQFMPQVQPMPSCGAVSINIMNPTVGYPMMPQNGVYYQYPQASYYSNQPQMMQYPMNYNNNIAATNPLNAVSNQPQTPPPAPVNNSGQTAQKTSEENKTDKKEEPKQKVVLTDDYIMSLENYLNSQDSKVRLMAAKELLERFKEDPQRKNDAALSALLNKVLQDPNSAVKFLGLTTLDAGYAKGDMETVNILKNIQATAQNDGGEDSLLASQILLKLSAGDKVPVESEAK